MKVGILLIFTVLMSSCTKNNCRATANPDCICTADYNPVCGCNDVTYSNPCTAECNGINNYSSGECK